VTSTQASGPANISRTSGQTATVTFASIKDAAGNPVPDGTVVAATVGNCTTTNQNGACNFSTGGSLVDGGSSPNGGIWKTYTVTGGQITVTYSPAGASTGTTARIQIAPAKPDGTVIQSRTLNGGTWDLQLVQ